MSLLAFVKYSGDCVTPSSAGFAMAVLRRGLHNLSISGSGSNGSSQYEGFSSSPLSSAWNCKNTSLHISKHNVQSRSRVWGVSLVIREVMGITSFLSNKDICLTRCHEGRNLNCGKEERFYFTKSYLINQQGLNLAGERGGEVGSRKCFFVSTKDGPLDLSLESSFGQGSRNLEQESEDVSGEDSFPRGTYQSPDDDHSALHHGGAADHVSATISEVDVGVMAELEDALGFPLGQGPQAPSPKPLVIVISGPSGVGKDAVIKKLQHARGDIHFVVTATTRSMRSTEVDGVDYHFMSKTEFQEMIENHELLEHAMVYGDYKGIPKQQVREFMSQGMDVVLRVDVQGAATVRSILGSEAVFIFLVAESETALVKRLIERKTESMDKMLVRVATAREELTRMKEFDYVVVNQEGCLDRTVSLICSIIDSEKARVKLKSAEI